MSVFHKLKASFGIGAAVVDTLIDKDTYEQGETVSGVVKVQGGKVEQQVKGIDLSLMTTVVVEGEDSEYLEEHCLKKLTVVENTRMKPEQIWEKPFSFVLPEMTPITGEEMKVWVRTEVDIARGADPVDVDPIKVLPSEKMQSFFQAFENLGFHLKKIKTLWRDTNENDIVQMYGYVPENGPFYEELDALVIAVYPEKEGLKIVSEVDRHSTGFAGLFAEALDADTSEHTFLIQHDHLREGAENLSGKIEKWLRSAI